MIDDPCWQCKTRPCICATHPLAMMDSEIIRGQRAEINALKRHVATLEAKSDADAKKPDSDTINLVIDACVAIENLLLPELADKRCDPAAVNSRLLEWIDKFVMEPESKKASGLQPISTAPHNERVLIFGKHSDGRDECAMAWLDIMDDYWYYSPQGGLIENWTPTHWMGVPLASIQERE